MEYYFATGMLDEAKFLVKKFHYSHRMPSNIQVIDTFHLSGGLFGNFGEAVCACIFSIPPTRWSEPVFELSRLVRSESFKPPLSMLISLTCKFIKQKKFCDLLISFADKSENHHGGIYQACSWNYDGLREPRMDGLIVNGKFVPGRTANSIYGTQSPVKLRTLLSVENKIQPHYDTGKHLYWRALDSSGTKKALRLGLRKTAYPKPNIVTTA